MNLKFEEKVILIIYVEFYKRFYNCWDKRLTENKKDKIKNIEVQSALYLFQQLGIYIGDFGFCQNTHGAYSPILEYILENLDKKGDLIDRFYREYQEMRNEKLNEILFKEREIKLIEKTAVLMKEIIEKENGAETLAFILFIAKSILPNASFESINFELKYQNPRLNDYNLNEKIYKRLEFLDLVPPVKFKTFTKI